MNAGADDGRDAGEGVGERAADRDGGVGEARRRREPVGGARCSPPTANGAAVGRPERTTPRITISSPKVATTSPSHRPPATRSWVERSTAGELEHQVGDDRADARADDLGGDVGAALARSVMPAERPVGERDDRVEVGARDRAEGEDQRDERRRRWPCEFSSSWRPTSSGDSRCGGDARADDDGDEQRGADGLGEVTRAAERWSALTSRAADGVGGAPSPGRPAAGERGEHGAIEHVVGERAARLGCTRPARRSARRWWLTSGWAASRSSTRWHTHRSSAARRSHDAPPQRLPEQLEQGGGRPLRHQQACISICLHVGPTRKRTSGEAWPTLRPCRASPPWTSSSSTRSPSRCRTWRRTTRTGGRALLRRAPPRDAGRRRSSSRWPPTRSGTSWTRCRWAGSAASRSSATRPGPTTATRTR